LEFLDVCLCSVQPSCVHLPLEENLLLLSTKLLKDIILMGPIRFWRVPMALIYYAQIQMS